MWVLCAGLLTAGAVALPQIAVSADMPMHGDMAGMNMMPHSASEHSAIAESYKKKAANYREDADMHRKMLAEYKLGAAKAPKQSENPWVAKMRRHCEKYIKDADTLAGEAEHFADFHTMQAKEVQGK